MSRSPLYAARALAAIATLALLAAACGHGPRGRPAAAPTTAAVERAQAHERARRYDLAQELYEGAIAAAPDAASRAWARRELAGSLAFWGRYAEAERQLEASLRDRDHAAAWHDLGILRHRRGALAEAEVALRRAAALDPRDPRPRIALAAMLVNARRLDDALAEYRDLLALELPEPTRAAVLRAAALVERERRRPAP